jgi:cytochrome c peroxidase
MLLPLLFSYRQQQNENHAYPVNKWYEQQLSSLNKEMLRFNALLLLQPKAEDLQMQFKKARIAYKRLSVLTDFFNPYETILINGPALERAEDDNPENIIPPHGLQQIESIIWGQDEYSKKIKDLQDETTRLISVLDQLEHEPDRINKFRNENVWYALRLQVINITTKGITGFDSPAALYSLPEAAAPLSAIQELVALYQNEEQDNAIYKSLDNLINTSIGYLEAHNNFNSFDRLTFIKTYLNPISEAMLDVIEARNFILPSERRP